MTVKGRYLLVTLMTIFLLAMFLAVRHPALIANSKYISSVILAELVVFCLWRFEDRFFPLLILAFLWAGGLLPLKDAASTVRWVVLAAAAGGGFVVWLGDKRHSFGIFHFVAAAGVLAALASCVVSINRHVALLKLLSVAMLFLFAATGGRAIFWHDPAQFIRRLTRGAEAMVFISAICYFIAQFPLFGNPNSLGAVMAFIEPLLFWQVLIKTDPGRRQIQITALILSGMLLYTSAARAAIVSAGITTLLLCLALRRFRILPKVALTAALVVSLGGVLQPSSFPEFLRSVTGDLIYKKSGEAGIFASRLNPWNEALRSFKAHPWIGSGFGIRGQATLGDTGALQTRSHATFEYGNSYLAILDYTGLVGITFFGGMIVLLLVRVAGVSFAIRKNPQLVSFAIPLMLVVVVGLLHAAFEDWLFAPGSYICIFFWCCAFPFMDFKPLPVRGQEVYAPPFSDPNQASQSVGFGMAGSPGIFHGQARPV
jgi:O-antigen ligase